MKKIFIPIIFLCCLIFSSCNQEDPGNQSKYPDGQWPPDNSSEIKGQLCYVANPFSENKDTILCIRDVYLFVKVHNAEYCTYLRNLMSTFEGRLFDCKFHDEPVMIHGWEFVPLPEQYFYPLRNGEFISFMDYNTQMMADSILMTKTEVNDIHKKEWIVTLFSRKRTEKIDDTRFFMDDYVHFEGNDYMSPKFITDTITPLGERLVCFDSQHGPFMSVRKP